MTGLKYLILTRLKNQVKAVFKNPGMIIFVLFMGACLILSLASSFMGGSVLDGIYRDRKEVEAMMMGLYTFVFITTMNQGFNQGANMYAMADVNLIFVSPIGEKKVLIYGLLKQIGTSLMVGLLLIFQYGWLSNTYGISISYMIAALIGYSVTIFCGQLLAMVIYSFTSGNRRRKTVIRGIFYGICGIFLFYLVINLLRNDDHILEAGIDSLNSVFIGCFPVSGWMKSVVAGGFDGNSVQLFCGLAALILFIIIMVSMIYFVRTDYYEDVLSAAELNYQTVLARKDGKIQDSSVRKAKKGKTGLTKGWGSSVFYYKHCLENRRSSVFYFDMKTLMFIAINIGFGYFMREAGIIAMIAFSAYLQFFTTALGRWVKELILPYIYLIPESPFRKLLYCIREAVEKCLVESLIIYIPLAFLINLSLTETAVCILCRFTFGILFLAGNIMVERICSGISMKVLVLAIYFVSMALMTVPGIVLAVVFSILFYGTGQGVAAAALALAVGNILVSLPVLFVSRNMLSYAELNQQISQ